MTSKHRQEPDPKQRLLSTTANTLFSPKTRRAPLTTPQKLPDRSELMHKAGDGELEAKSRKECSTRSARRKVICQHPGLRIRFLHARLGSQSRTGAMPTIRNRQESRFCPATGETVAIAPTAAWKILSTTPSGVVVLDQAQSNCGSHSLLHRYPKLGKNRSLYITRTWDSAVVSRAFCSSASKLLARPSYCPPLLTCGNISIAAVARHGFNAAIHRSRSITCIGICRQQSFLRQAVILKSIKRSDQTFFHSLTLHAASSRLDILIA